MSDLNMHRIAAKFMPRLLILDQKEPCAKIGQDLHQRALDDPTFMSCGARAIGCFMMAMHPLTELS